LRVEQAYLERCGLGALALKAENVTRTKGDGLGYDVLSFDESGNEKYIEVKTTMGGSHAPFYITANELAVSDRYKENYWLYRVFRSEGRSRIFRIQGRLSEQLRLVPMQFQAVFAK